MKAPLLNVLLGFLFLFTLPAVSKSQQAFYPSLEQIEKDFTDIEKRYPDLASVQYVGVSSDGNHKMIALKITSNVNQQSDKPVWMFTGCVHGSEQMGTKLVVDLAKELTEGANKDGRINEWLDAYEIWLVPVGNPSGYSARTRKNQFTSNRRNAPGVDLNRNFGFRWEKGPEVDPLNSRYKGESAFSEKETQGLRDLYLKLQPVFGITFHQGNQPDGGQIMVPWSTRGGVPGPPDSAVINHYAKMYAGWIFDSRKNGRLCELTSDGSFALTDPDGVDCDSVTNNSNFCKDLCLEPDITTLGAYGQSSNYYYASVGTIDFTMELSHRLFNEPFMHQAQAPKTKREETVLEIATEIVNNNIDGIKDWLDYFLLNHSGSQPLFRGPGLTGHIRDEATGNPVLASIEFEGFESRLTTARKSNSAFGRFWKLLPSAGTYKVIVEAPGYEDKGLNVAIGADAMTQIDILLKPN